MHLGSTDGAMVFNDWIDCDDNWDDYGSRDPTDWFRLDGKLCRFRDVDEHTENAVFSIYKRCRWGCADTDISVAKMARRIWKIQSNNFQICRLLFGPGNTILHTLMEQSQHVASSKDRCRFINWCCKSDDGFPRRRNKFRQTALDIAIRKGVHQREVLCLMLNGFHENRSGSYEMAHKNGSFGIGSTTREIKYYDQLYNGARVLRELALGGRELHINRKVIREMVRNNDKAGLQSFFFTEYYDTNFSKAFPPKSTSFLIQTSQENPEKNLENTPHAEVENDKGVRIPANLGLITEELPDISVLRDRGFVSNGKWENFSRRWRHYNFLEIGTSNYNTLSQFHFSFHDTQSTGYCRNLSGYHSWVGKNELVRGFAVDVIYENCQALIPRCWRARSRYNIVEKNQGNAENRNIGQEDSHPTWHLTSRNRPPMCGPNLTVLNCGIVGRSQNFNQEIVKTWANHWKVPFKYPPIHDDDCIRRQDREVELSTPRRGTNGLAANELIPNTPSDEASEHGGSSNASTVASPAMSESISGSQNSLESPLVSSTSPSQNPSATHSAREWSEYPTTAEELNKGFGVEKLFDGTPTFMRMSNGKYYPWHRDWEITVEYEGRSEYALDIPAFSCNNDKNDKKSGNVTVDDTNGNNDVTVDGEDDTVVCPDQAELPALRFYWGNIAFAKDFQLYWEGPIVEGHNKWLFEEEKAGATIGYDTNFPNVVVRNEGQPSATDARAVQRSPLQSDQRSSRSAFWSTPDEAWEWYQDSPEWYQETPESVGKNSPQEGEKSALVSDENHSPLVVSPMEPLASPPETSPILNEPISSAAYGRDTTTGENSSIRYPRCDGSDLTPEKPSAKEQVMNDESITSSYVDEEEKNTFLARLRDEVLESHFTKKNADAPKVSILFHIPEDGIQELLRDWDQRVRHLGSLAQACSAIDQLPNYFYNSMKKLDKLHMLKATILPSSLTYAQLCKKHEIDSVDYLQLDCEGLDYDIMRGIFEHILARSPAARPEVIVFEASTRTLHEAREVADLFEMIGYSVSPSNFMAHAVESQAKERVCNITLSLSREEIQRNTYYILSEEPKRSYRVES